MSSFKKYLYTTWPTLGREVVDAIKARTGAFCTTPYKDITAHAVATVAADPDATNPSAWATPTFRTSLVAQLVDQFAPKTAPKAKPASAAKSEDEETGYVVKETGQPITRAMLKRVDYLVGDRVDDQKC